MRYVIETTRETTTSELADEVVATIEAMEHDTRELSGLVGQVRRRLNARGVWPHVGAPSVADPGRWDAGL